MKRVAILLLLVFLFPLRVGADGGTEVARKTRSVALTFDDGPHPGNTGRILDVLHKYDVRATFFILGCNAVNYPAPLARAIEEGHEIENHSMDHQTKGKTVEELEEDIEQAAELIIRETGRRPRYFRPPEGRCPPEMKDALDILGYEPIYWTIDSGDWRGEPASEIVRAVLRVVRGDDIILFHDYTCPGGNTARALDMLIPALKKRGYRFVTVEELQNQTASQN